MVLIITLDTLPARDASHMLARLAKPLQLQFELPGRRDGLSS